MTATRFRMTVVLALAAAAFAAYYFGVERQEHEERRRSAATDAPAFERLLPGWRAADQRRIVVERGEGEAPRVALERADAHSPWRLTEPLEDLAHPSRVAAMLQGVELADRLETFTDYDPAALGLEPPAIVARFTGADGRERAVELGGRDLTGRRVHARVAGRDEAYLLSGLVEEGLDVAADDLRQRALTTIDPLRVERLIVKGPRHELRFKKDGRFWVMDHPEAGFADGERIGRLLTAIGRTEATRFVDDAPERLGPFGLRVPLALVTLEGASAQQTVAFGERTDRAGEIYARRGDQPAVLAVEDRISDIIIWDVASWRSRLLFHVRPADIDAIEVREGGRDGAVVTQLLRDEERAWRFTAPRETAADRRAVDALLDALLTTQADETATAAPSDPANYGLERPLVVSLGARGIQHTLEVGGGSHRPEGRYVRRGGEEAVLDVLLPEADTLAQAYPVLRDRRLLRLRADEIVRLDIEGLDRPLRPYVRLPAGGYSTPEARVDEASLDRALRLLAELRAERLVPAPADPGAHGLAQPWLAVTARRAPAPDGADAAGEPEGERITLELGAAAPDGGYYARLRHGEEPAVHMVLAEPAVELLEREHLLPDDPPDAVAPAPERDQERDDR